MREKLKKEILELIKKEIRIWLPISEDDGKTLNYNFCDYAELDDLILMILNELKLKPYLTRKIIKFRKS